MHGYGINEAPLELDIDLGSIRLNALEPHSADDNLNSSVSGGVMGIALLFAGQDASMTKLSQPPKDKQAPRSSASKFRPGTSSFREIVHNCTAASLFRSDFA